MASNFLKRVSGFISQSLVAQRSSPTFVRDYVRTNVSPGLVIYVAVELI